MRHWNRKTNKTVVSLALQRAAPCRSLMKMYSGLYWLQLAPLHPTRLPIRFIEVAHLVHILETVIVLSHLLHNACHWTCSSCVIFHHASVTHMLHSHVRNFSQSKWVKTQHWWCCDVMSGLIPCWHLADRYTHFRKIKLPNLKIYKKISTNEPMNCVSGPWLQYFEWPMEKNPSTNIFPFW